MPSQLWKPTAAVVFLDTSVDFHIGFSADDAADPLYPDLLSGHFLQRQLLSAARSSFSFNFDFYPYELSQVIAS